MRPPHRPVEAEALRQDDTSSLPRDLLPLILATAGRQEVVALALTLRTGAVQVRDRAGRQGTGGG